MSDYDSEIANHTVYTNKGKFKRVKLTYFKSSGKYYSRAFYGTDLKLDYEIYEEVRKMVNGYNGGLPGLSTTTWKDYILVEPEDGVSALLDIRKMVDEIVFHHNYWGVSSNNVESKKCTK